MMPSIRKSKKGVSLIEVMIAVLITAIVMLGGSMFFASSTGQINLREQYRAASRLASQRLEEYKAADYVTVAEGEVQDSVTLESSSYNRSVVTQDIGSYKQVTVNVTWGPSGQQKNINLVTFIAPK
ncbi:MAG: prepilin-type N-terminal cleavage/methylation domain-containing protein [Planctomycetes bacterium]|nr:prepilin-type N-terminal cleavage/methylation domain-containing protein [Planctomycetota bacterium]